MDEDYCPRGVNNEHDPDWDTVSTEYDGETLYVDVHCKNCGKHGCVGSHRTLIDQISW